MHIKDILSTSSPSLSFEFFPPKSEKGSEELYKTISELESLNPSFVSVTYGAGGTTRELTHDLVVRIKKTTSIEPVPHLTCVGHSEEEMEMILKHYAEADVKNVLALRGDPPRGVKNYDHNRDALSYASDLVSFVKEHQADFGIGVAGFPEGHPTTPNRLQELDFLKAKVDAGADYICTQLFFDNSEFFDFRERCSIAGINVPIIAGIMPITTINGMKRMAELSGGTKFPAKLLRQLQRVEQDPAAVERIGLHYATEQCNELLDQGVSGLHFYTLNKSNATKEIWERLSLSSAR